MTIKPFLNVLSVEPMYSFSVWLSNFTMDLFTTLSTRQLLLRGQFAVALQSSFIFSFLFNTMLLWSFLKLFHVQYTSITYVHCISTEYFGQPGLFGKMVLTVF